MTAPRIASAVFDPMIGVNWSTQVWDATLEDAREAGFTNIVIQHTAVQSSSGVRTIYPSTISGTVPVLDAQGNPVDLVGTILPLARKHGLTVRLGLYSDNASWFQDLGPAPADLQFTQQIASELWGSYWNYYDVIVGWYLPAEVNVNMIDSPHRIAVAEYFSDAADYLHTNHNNMSVMISPYFNANAGQTATDWTVLWTDILGAAELDIVALQDGVGDPGASSTRTQIDTDLASWFGATHQALIDSGSSAQMWDNVDLYGSNGAAADLFEVELNMAAPQAFVSGYTSFGYFSQWAPWAIGTDALHLQFVAWN